MKASLSEEAIEDTAAAADWYIDQGAYDAAEAFSYDLERSIRMLQRHPRSGTPGVAQTRSLRLRPSHTRSFISCLPTASASLQSQPIAAVLVTGWVGGKQRRLVGLNCNLPARPPYLPHWSVEPCRRYRSPFGAPDP
jgi:plasmid stabilization system protein ParE